MDAVSRNFLCLGKCALARGLAIALAALLLSHGSRAEPVPGVEIPADCAQANRKLVALYSKLGATQSLAYSTRAFQICSEHKGAQHPDTLDSMNNLAFNYRAVGRYGEALALTEASLKLRRETQGDDHPSTLLTMSNLAASYVDLGQPAQAFVLYEEVLKKRRAKYGPRHPDTAVSMNNLATSYVAMGRYVDALALHREALALMRATLGADHGSTLISISNLARSYSALGRYAEALALREEMLNLLHTKLGPKHFDTLIAMSNLALSYEEVGRHAEALALHEEVLSLRRAALGPDHPHTLISMNHVAESYAAIGRLTDALALHEDSLKRSRMKLGTDHPQTLSIMSNLALSYSVLGRYDEALALNQEVLNLRRVKLGTAHPMTMGSMHNVAVMHRELGAYEKALELNGETARLMREALGAEHPDTLGSMSNLAMSYRDAGRNAEAVKLNEQTLDLKKQTLGEDHPGTLLTMHNLAQSYFSVGRLQDIPALGRAYLAGAEKQRGQKGLAVDEQLFADHANNYRQFSRYFGRLATDELQSQEHDRKALLQEGFEIAERAKARTLVENIARPSAGRVAGLSTSELQALERLSGESAALGLAIARQQDLRKVDDEILKSLQTRKREVDAQSRDLQHKLKATYPKYAQLLDVTFAPAAVAQQYLGADQQLISYVIENNGNISAWLLDQGGAPRFIDLGQHKTLSETLARLRKQISESKERAVSAELLQSLSAVLIHPLLEQLAPSKRWIIIPDGDLALLPFDTLLLPGGEALIKQHEISIAQSWSVYTLLKQREAEYSKLRRAKNLLAVGNAVYEADSPDATEERSASTTPVRGNYRMTATLAVDLAGGLREPAERYALQNLSWSNLPGTAMEIEAVSKIFDTGVDTFTGALASESQMQALNRSGKLTGYRYLLFSAHGYLASNPMLTSLVLSQHQRTPEADGYITTAEWPGYDIRSDLAVFSGCHTGVGTTLTGEGVMGLPYALFVAGNKNTLLTLWPVDDAATAEFMRRFFGRLAQGEAQVSALIETKREFAAHPQWHAPVYWSGFVLYGV